jgi:hypothetical protein
MKFQVYLEGSLNIYVSFMGRILHLWRGKKSNKNDGQNHHIEDKMDGQKRPKDAHPTWTKERRELVLVVVGNYFTHNPSNFTCIQVWDLIVIGGLEQSSFANTIFLSIT